MPLCRSILPPSVDTLSGDVRRVPMVGQRITEAVRLGYARVLAPIGATAALESRTSDVEIIEVHPAQPSPSVGNA